MIIPRGRFDVAFGLNQAGEHLIKWPLRITNEGLVKWVLSVDKYRLSDFSALELSVFIKLPEGVELVGGYGSNLTDSPPNLRPVLVSNAYGGASAKWWHVKPIVLTHGLHRIKCQFDAQSWSNTSGQNPPDQFRKLLKKHCQVGFTLSKGMFYGKGLKTVSGSVEISLKDAILIN